MIGGSAGMGPRGLLGSFGETRSGKVFDPHVAGRILRFVRPYRGKMAVALLLMTAGSALSLLAPYLMKIAIDTHIAGGSRSGLARVSFLLIGTFTGIYLADAGERYLLGWVGQQVLADLRDRLFDHLQRLHPGYHDTHIVGVTISRVINDVGTLGELLSQGLVTLIGDVLLLAGIMTVMIAMSPSLALLSFSVLPFMVLATVLFSRKAKGAFRETRSTVASVVGDLAENISGMRVIQAFAREEASRERFDRVNRRNRSSHVRAMSLSFVFLPAVEFLSMLATAVVLYFGGLSVARDTLTLGVMVAFLTYVSRFFQPVRELSQLYTTFQAAMAGGEQVFRLLDTEPEVADRTDARPMPPVRGRIELRNVSFAYREGVPVLRSVDLTVEPGSMVALVGPTGAGKSTIASLIARFYDPGEGAVMVDGIDIRDVLQRTLRAQMALVPQDPFLFAGSVADNIRFGRPGADADEVERAAGTANAWGFIERLPEGPDTPVREGGVNLSVGQRQLISIARAVLADPRILIMDEATSTVDTVTEALIQDALKNLLQGRTSVVIAHRLSTIRDADTILVVDEGRIVERGSHRELLRSGGRYSDLYRRQFIESADSPPKTPKT